MIKIYNPNASKQTIGGGWTFRRNIEKALVDRVSFHCSVSDCDIFLISAVTLVDEGEVKLAKDMGKKIVLRVDNMPRKSRNRMTPHERMKEYASMADAVVYQSDWARMWIGGYLGMQGHVIYNGVDTDVFKSIQKPERSYKEYLIVHFNRDENKRIPEALDWYTQEWLKNGSSKLKIIGQFSPEIIASNFDFWHGESFEYCGVIPEQEELARRMAQADILLYPSYSDACPNTVLEALSCGLDVWHNGYAGTNDVMRMFVEHGRKWLSLSRMGNEYMKLFESL